jgi:hypothetical protein
MEILRKFTTNLGPEIAEYLVGVHIIQPDGKFTS